MIRIVLLVVLVAACWRNAPPPAAPPPAPPPTAPPPAHAPAPPPREIDVVMARFEQFADEMCNCQDNACAQAVADEMTRWSQEQARTHADPPELGPEDQQRAAEIGERMGECMQNAITNGATTP